MSKELDRLEKRVRDIENLGVAGEGRMASNTPPCNKGARKGRAGKDISLSLPDKLLWDANTESGGDIAVYYEVQGVLGRMSCRGGADRGLISLDGHCLTVPADIFSDLIPYQGQRIAIIRSSGTWHVTVRAEIR